jgi:hypothetical protein
MRAADIIAALSLPAAALVDQRIPKKLLTENAATAKGDRRRITDGIDEIRWVAALKPSTIGVAVYRDVVREYLEIAVLSAAFREEADAARLTELVHRAIPYPVVLIEARGDAASISLAHKRRSEGELDATVLDGDLVSVTIGVRASVDDAFLGALTLACQPRTDLYSLYQGWIDTATGHQVAQITGTFSLPDSQEHSSARRAALSESKRLGAEMTRVRREAERETQLARQVELNIELTQLRAAHDVALRQL